MPNAATTVSADHRVNIVSDLLRLPAVVRHTGLSRSTIYRLMAARHVRADPILTHPADPILTRGWTPAA